MLKLSSIFVLAFIAFSQALPIGEGLGTLVNNPGINHYMDWYITTPSGCSAGAGQHCTGTQPIGDTAYCVGLPNASGLPVTSGNPTVCTLNDFLWSSSPTTAGNLMLFQQDTFDWATPAASRMTLVNAMSTYGTTGADTDAPSGWHGHCSQGDDGASNACTWKSRRPISVGGKLYMTIRRVPSAGNNAIGDGTIIMSPDSGAHWCNPYTLYNPGGGGTVGVCNALSPWDANGDAPKCGAASSSSGSNCTDTGYLDSTHSSMMWKSLPGTLYMWSPVLFNIDGTTPPSPPDGSDPSTYVYMLGEGDTAAVNADGSALRVPVGSLQDISTYRYYTCPTITDNYRCPIAATGSWTATFANRTTVIPTWGWSATYIPTFKSYLFASNQGMLMSKSWIGPYQKIDWPGGNYSVNFTFMDLVPSLGYTEVDPTHVKLTAIGTNLLHSVNRTVEFEEWDLTVGHDYTGQRPVYANGYNTWSGAWEVHGGLIFSDVPQSRTIPRNGLIAAYDMFDYGTATATSGGGGFLDMSRDGTNRSSFLAPFFSSTFGWNSGQGLQLAAYGPTLSGTLGYPILMKTVTYSRPTTVGGSFSDFNMSAMAGNASWSIAVVFRMDTPSDPALDTVPIWQIGDPTGGNTAISLSYAKGTNSIELGWGTANFVSHYRYATGWVPTPGNYYFICATVQANGSTPTSHLWVGSGGNTLVDKLAGISRTASSGSGTPSATPNVTATPMYLGQDVYQSASSLNGGYAGIFPYSRALTQAEVLHMYKVLKVNTDQYKGITLQ